MGGGSSSTNKSTIDTSSVVNALSQSIMNCSSLAANDMNLNINATDSKISGISQKQSLTLSSTCTNSAQNLTNIQTAVINALKATADSQSEAITGVLGKSDADVETLIKNDVESNITNQTISNIVNSANNKMNMNISGSGLDIKNISQEQTVEFLSQAAASTVNSLSTVTAMNNAADTESKSTQKSPFQGFVDAFANAATIITVVIVIAILIVVLLLGKPIMNFLKGGVLINTSNTEEDEEVEDDKTENEEAENEEEEDDRK